MSDLPRIANKLGSTLAQAGMGLKTISELLGCDGCEHDLTEENINGLHHAVAAIADLVAMAGYELCGQVEIAESMDSKGGAQ
ncbi:hypothetical protein [Pseudomonas sp.]|uniref:hypothetical protein n=1 Tax=Pseudomonas sp. TaxID=306 RepID=UPI002C73A7FA|nr:hypothetical protein [Pseudomonas sp.]HUE93578.1 hypothetical protein [Pseudomonas sp.]